MIPPVLPHYTVQSKQRDKPSIPVHKQMGPSEGYHNSRSSDKRGLFSLCKIQLHKHAVSFPWNIFHPSSPPNAGKNENAPL